MLASCPCLRYDTSLDVTVIVDIFQWSGGNHVQQKLQATVRLSSSCATVGSSITCSIQRRHNQPL